jgi:hypothetical protein
MRSWRLLRRNGDRTARYLHARETSQRAVPFDMPPDPDRGSVLQRVRQLTESLDGAIDEGTGSALDRLIESWIARWIATVEAGYADHCAVISVYRGQAGQRLTEAVHTAGNENEELDRIRGAYLACQSRLASEQADRAVPDMTPAMPADPRPDWSAPHLLSGRSRIRPVVTALLALIGAFTVTVAVRTTPGS